jgi:Contractile injection system tube protein/LysM domain
MPTPLKGHIDVAWRRGQQRIDFQYNPTDLEFTRNVHIAEITIPGLDSPLLQFIRGNNETLAVTLFFDTTDFGMGTKPTVNPVTTFIDKIYALTKIDPDSHAPPVCEFQWGRGFPGGSLPDQAGNQSRTSFRCLVEQVVHKYTLFSPNGVPLRATAVLKLREYKPLTQQLNQLGLNSPDKTQVRVLRGDETLSSIAGDHYRSPGDWRVIADANAIEDPRRLRPGMFLTLPPLD